MYIHNFYNLGICWKKKKQYHTRLLQSLNATNICWVTHKNTTIKTVIRTEKDDMGNGCLMYFMYATPRDSHQPYEANIATMFYKTSFVALINWKQKKQTISLEKGCANINPWCSRDTFSLVTSLGNNFWTQKYDAPVTRFSRRKLHFDKISSPHQHLLSACVFSQDKTHLILLPVMKNVIFKALSNKSTLGQHYLRPTDYCIMASTRNLHLLGSTDVNYAR